MKLSVILWGGIIGCIGVPLFYFISGYLFFQGEGFTKKIYKEKIIRRVKTLLIPYLCWNLIAYFLYAFVIGSIRYDQFLQSFWVIPQNVGHSPANGPLWFLRTLIILSLISPICYLINSNKILSYLSPLMLLAWLFNIPGVQSGTVIGFIFFNIGSWLAITKADLKLTVPKTIYAFYSIALVYSAAVICELLFFRFILWHKLTILLGFILIYTLPTLKTSCKLCSLSAASFLMYCLHDLLFSILQFADKQHIIQGGYWYVLIVGIDAVICIYLYGILKKWSPNFCILLTGNR